MKLTAQGDSALRIISTTKLVSSWSAEVAIRPAATFFEGHFPGCPILPAIAQLALLELGVERATRQAVTLLYVKRARLLRQVEPGEELLLKLSTRQGGGLTFVFLRGQERVADGVVVFRTGEADLDGR